MSKYLPASAALIALGLIGQPIALSQEAVLDEHANHDHHDDHETHEDPAQHDHEEDHEHDEHEDHDHDAHEDGDHDHSKTLETIIVQATRSGRLLQDEPMRVEVVPREEIEEKAIMRPGNIATFICICHLHASMACCFQTNSSSTQSSLFFYLCDDKTEYIG